MKNEGNEYDDDYNNDDDDDSGGGGGGGDKATSLSIGYFIF